MQTKSPSSQKNAQQDLPLQVVGAVVYRKKTNPEILAFQRSATDVGGGSWEFPGGKAELGETFEAAIVREIQEELGVKARVLKFLGSKSHAYPQRTICLHLFLVELEQWTLSLTDHQCLVWLDEESAPHFAWAEADLPWLPKIFKILNEI